MPWIRLESVYINLDHVYAIKVLRDGTLVLRFPDGYEQELYDASALFQDEAEPFGAILHVPLMHHYKVADIHRFLSRSLLDIDHGYLDVKRLQGELNAFRIPERFVGDVCLSYAEWAQGKGPWTAFIRKADDQGLITGHGRTPLEAVLKLQELAGLRKGEQDV